MKTPKPHRFPVRIYYDHTDAGGVVYNANYIRFWEHARAEVLRDAGILQSQLSREDGNVFVVGELTARYLAPARLDDELIVETTVLKIGGASMKLQQNILRRLDKDETLLLKGSVTLVYVTHAGQPVRIPDTIRQALEPFIIAEDPS